MLLVIEVLISFLWGLLLSLLLNLLHLLVDHRVPEAEGLVGVGDDLRILAIHLQQVDFLLLGVPDRVLLLSLPVLSSAFSFAPIPCLVLVVPLLVESWFASVSSLVPPWCYCPYSRSSG